MIQPGPQTSEHKRALRAECFGAAIAVLGAILAFYGARDGQRLAAGIGLAMLCAGLALIASACHAYANSRAIVKAAASTERQEIHHRHTGRGI